MNFYKLIKSNLKLSIFFIPFSVLLIDQIFSTVRWRESLIYMSKKGENNFIEIGPGKALTGMVKRTLKDVNSFSINSIADIKNFENEFRK